MRSVRARLGASPRRLCCTGREDRLLQSPLYSRGVEIEAALSAAGAAIRPALLPLQVRNTLWKCLERALEHASREQGQSAETIPALLIQAIDDEEARISALLSAEIGDPAWRENWTTALHEVLLDSSVDWGEVDLRGFCQAAFGQYAAQITTEAKRPGSKLTNALSISILTASSPAASEPSPPLRSGPFSNLWKHPRPARVHARRGVQTVEDRLSKHGAAHLAGGPGSGKSIIARMVADRALAADPELSVWWMDCSSREALEASCVELCTERGLTPGEDVVRQVRGLLARHGTWLIVLDDASPEHDGVIPSGKESVRTLTTSRSPLGTDPGIRVTLGAADHELMLEIARDSLAGTGLEASLEAIVEACDANPLAVATVCRYLAATGATEEDVPALLAETPDEVLDEPLGEHYPRTFTTVVTTALTRISGSTAEQLLVALALADGRLRRRDLAEIAAPESRTAFLEGLRPLLEMGLIDATSERIRCHGLIASVVVRRSDAQVIEPLAERAFDLLAADAAQAGPFELHEHARLADALHRASPMASPLEVRALLALATRLSIYGLGRTADRQIERARHLLADSPDGTLHALLTTTDAGALFQRGDLAGAEQRAREALDHLAEHDVDDDAAQVVYVRAVLCLARCREYFGDPQRAAQYAQYAVEASSDNPDVRAIATKLSILTMQPRERFAALLELADSPDISPTSRAEYLSSASRAALDLEDPGEAIRCARSALEIDTAQTGPESQFTARDLNDLGNALIEAGELTEAAEHLRRSISLYESELPEHGYSVQPRTHLARVLTARAMQEIPFTPALLDESREVLAPALKIQRRIAPETVEMSSLLVAQANATPDPPAAIEALKEALAIDRELYGDAHPEVCIDVIQLVSRHLEVHDLRAAVDALQIVVPHVSTWERERPSLTVNVLSLLLLVRAMQGPGAGTAQEITALRERITRLLPVIPQDSSEYDQAGLALAATETGRG